MEKQYDIFISHASADKKLAEKFVDLVLQNGCDVRREQILCTSLEGMEIPAGTENFIKFLNDQIRSPNLNLVILLLSENYFESRFCVCELGATWGMELTTFPMLVSPIENTDLSGVLKVTQTVNLLEPKGLDQLRDRVHERLNTIGDTSRWNKKRDEFLEEADRILKQLPKPNTVSRNKYERIKEKHKDAQEEISNKNDHIKQLKEQIAALKECKDREEVREIDKSFSSSREQFDNLCKTLCENLNRLNPATIKLIYYKYSNVSYDIEDHEWSDIKRAEQLMEILEGELNESNTQVLDAQDALRELDYFFQEMESQKSEFFDDLSEEYGFDVNLNNIRFWEKCLRVI